MKKRFLLLTGGLLTMTALAAQAFTLSSTAFKEGASIPSVYTCEGKDKSPPLAWSTPPAKTQSLALIMDDPDAPMGTWDHWILFNIPPNTTSFPEGMQTPPTGSVGGANSWKKNNYGGPCPPDREHRYFFKLYALDTQLNLPAGSSKQAVLAAMKGHVLAEAGLMGRYDKKKR